MKLPSLTKQHQGEAYALGLSVIEAAFPLFAFFTVTALGAMHAYFYSLVVATGLLVFWVIVRKKTHELKRSHAYKDLAFTSLYITTVFSLVFLALQYTSPSHVMIILFLQVLFSYLFLGRQSEEKLDRPHLLGVVLMTMGAIIILFPADLKPNPGDFLALLAAITAPIANYYQKRARQKVSSETILMVRGLIALPFIYVLAITFEPSPSWLMIQEQFIWLFLTGFLVFVLAKLMWIEALHRMPITKLNAMFAFSPLLTIFLVYLVLNEIPSWIQLFGALPILIGSIFITQKLSSK
ncbi:MAG: DMT family transporter [Pseudomonadota bacterium]|nr:DMT family transporter [Pseudomonadota bacterium]